MLVLDELDLGHSKLCLSCFILEKTLPQRRVIQQNKYVVSKLESKTYWKKLLILTRV